MVTFNVNGIRDTDKRRAIFNYLKHFNSQIVLLQETHSSPEVEKVWSNEWGRKIIFNHGTNTAKGVALLIQRGFPMEIEDYRFDIEGRYLVMDVNIEGRRFVLVNIYAPNEDDAQFYTRLFKVIASRDNPSIMIAGDFNTTLDPQLDLYNNQGLNHKKKRTDLLHCMEEFNLVEPWRIKNSQDRVFTWRKPHSRELVMSRLDFWLVSTDFLPLINSITIRTKYNSDHSRVVMNIDLSPFKRGRSYWKFNNLLLKDKNFLDEINQAILRFKWAVKNSRESNPETQWVTLKEKIIVITKDFATKKAKEKSQFIELMEKKILLLDKKILEETNLEKQIKLRNDLHKTENFLLDEHDSRVKAAMFRSKAQYYLYGEKNSRYFFNLEKN